MQTFDVAVKGLREEFPGVRVVEKRGLLRIMGQGFVTTIGKWIFVPAEWDVSDEGKYQILGHERIHLIQQKRLGLGSIWLGMVPFLIAYLLLPLPIGLAYCRYRFEREAYAEGVGLARAIWGERVATLELNEAVRVLTTRTYLWCWPFPKKVRAWFDLNA